MRADRARDRSSTAWSAVDTVGIDLGDPTPSWVCVESGMRYQFPLRAPILSEIRCLFVSAESAAPSNVRSAHY